MASVRGQRSSPLLVLLHGWLLLSQHHLGAASQSRFNTLLQDQGVGLGDAAGVLTRHQSDPVCHQVSHSLLLLGVQPPLQLQLQLQRQLQLQ